MPDFLSMSVLKPNQEGEYPVVSYCESQADFKSWTKSPAIMEGHRRGFEDIKQEAKRGATPPMTSDFRTYIILTH